MKDDVLLHILYASLIELILKKNIDNQGLLLIISLYPSVQIQHD